MPAYKIKHLTRYTYASTVIDCVNQIMLYPIADKLLDVKKHEIKITHNPDAEVFTDFFGNQVGVFSVLKPHTELLIESTAEVVTHAIFFPMDEASAEEQWNNLKALKSEVAYMDFLTHETFPSYDEMKNVVNSVINYSEKPLKNALVLSEYVYNNFIYQKGVTSIETPMQEVWKLKAGVCQDFAHILLIMLRMIGIPARYISGYVCPKADGVRGEGATHAWVEAYIPFYGWLGLDPTNNCIVSDGHVRIALGRNFSDCTPVKGTYKGSGDHKLEVTVNIENGNPKNNENTESKPSYIFEVKHPAPATNSYQRYKEMQQKQQQQ